MASLSGEFQFQQFTDAGVPLVGGRVYTYSAGTTTHKTAYTDAGAATPHTYTSDGLGGQYIALDSRGELPAPLFLATGNYDILLKRSDGSTVWTRRAVPMDDASVGLVDGLIDDLADTTDVALGDAMIGTKPTWTGSVSRTQHLKNQDTVCSADFGTSTSNTGAQNSAAFQKFLDHLRDVGGYGWIPYGTYAMAGEITLEEDTTNSPAQTFVIDGGGGATFDWRSSGRTSGNGIFVGAQDISRVHERGFGVLRGFRILGPETQNCSVSGGIVFPTPVTTFIGLRLDFALDITIDNVFVQRCYEGIKASRCWPIHGYSVNCSANYIGLHLADTMTLGDWYGCSLQASAYGLLMRPDNTGENIECQNFYNLRLENNLRPITLDPLESGGSLTLFRNISFYGTRFEQNAYDLIQAGREWVFASPEAAGTQRTDYTQGLFLYGGSWDAPIGDGVGTYYRVRGSSNGYCRGGDFNIPVGERTQINGTFVAVTMHIQPDPNGGSTSGNTYFPDGSTIHLGSNQILTTRQTGWTAATGTPLRTAYTAAAPGTANAAYVQADFQSALDRISKAERRILALETDLTTHGLIGA
ncbi:MAG: hypothetical protein KIH64_014825 [Mycobacterium sp.]|nr:hypothetical protein [Mycobacterium sp.]